MPLTTNNVLCVEDDAPTTTWDGLIRHTLNYRMKCSKAPLHSYSEPPTPWLEDDGSDEVLEVSDIDGLMDTVLNNDALESSSLLKENLKSSDSHWMKKDRERQMDETVRNLTRNVKTCEDWLHEAAMLDEDVTENSNLDLPSRSLIDHSCNRYLRVASKQMVGVFITIWVRADLRRHIHNVKVCVVGCGILNFLQNKVCFTYPLQ